MDLKRAPHGMSCSLPITNHLTISLSWIKDFKLRRAGSKLGIKVSASTEAIKFPGEGTTAGEGGEAGDGGEAGEGGDAAEAWLIVTEATMPTINMSRLRLMIAAILGLAKPCFICTLHEIFPPTLLVKEPMRM
jgi:hypothetical protein